MKYSATVNHDAVFTIEKNEEGWMVNNKLIKPDWQKLGKNRYHVLSDNASFTIEFSPIDEKSYEVLVNGTAYQIILSDEYDALLKQLGMSNTSVNGQTELKAPMPGIVLKTLVHEGEQVNKGDNLLVLEAMKMENMIKSQGQLTIKSLHVKTGQSVEKGQLLISFL